MSCAEHTSRATAKEGSCHCEGTEPVLQQRMTKWPVLHSTRRGAASDGRRKLSSMVRGQHLAALRVGSWRSIQTGCLAASHRRSLVCSKACIIGLGHHIGCSEALLCTCQCEHHVCMAPRRVTLCVEPTHMRTIQSCHAKKNSRAIYRSFVPSPRTIPPKISSRGQNFSHGRISGNLTSEPLRSTSRT